MFGEIPFCSSLGVRGLTLTKTLTLSSDIEITISKQIIKNKQINET